ncbi:MAG: MBL fold metallo-hydrolase [Clostridia bacterium]|nr:MBL fold metallo-hydrolase [Clostridia bacterium]MBR7099425.1 MBL fold metallo-hydrolase [Clostridia bacterium]
MSELKFPRPEGVVSDTPVSRTTGVLRVPGADRNTTSYYRALLEKNGFCCMMERELPSGEFFVYGNGEVKLSFAFLLQRAEMRVFYEAMPAVTDFSKSGKKIYDNVTLTQFSTNTARSIVDTTSCGMGYIVRLRDGRLIVVDGGFKEGQYGDDYPEFVQLLWDLSGGKKPRVAAWILTHVHSDHFGLMAKLKPEDANIKAYFSTIPVDGWGSDYVAANLPHYAEKNVTLHAGDHYVFDKDVSLDVFYTLEETAMYEPDNLKSCNDQSLIFTINIGEQKVMFVGDAGHHAERLAMEIAGGLVKSDVCQVGHHGRISQKDNWFYSFVAPKVALWPSCYAQLDLDIVTRGSGSWLRGKISTVVDHYVAYDGTETLTFPYEVKGKPFRSPIADKLKK